MSAESARAFCMRLMSDEDFQAALASAADVSAIELLMKKENYAFTQHELLKIVGELTGKTLSVDEFKAMVSEFYVEELAKDNPKAPEIVSAWIDSLQ